MRGSDTVNNGDPLDRSSSNPTLDTAVRRRRQTMAALKAVLGAWRMGGDATAKWRRAWAEAAAPANSADGKPEHTQTCNLGTTCPPPPNPTPAYHTALALPTHSPLQPFHSPPPPPTPPPLTTLRRPGHTTPALPTHSTHCTRPTYQFSERPSKDLLSSTVSLGKSDGAGKPSSISMAKHLK